jgi:hypothetical protein
VTSSTKTNVKIKVQDVVNEEEEQNDQRNSSPENPSSSESSKYFPRLGNINAKSPKKH